MVGLAYGLAGLMAGVAGVLVAPLTGALAAAGAGLGLKAFAIAIVGGLDSITGTPDRRAPARRRRAVHRAVHLAGAARCRGLHDRHRDTSRPPPSGFWVRARMRRFSPLSAVLWTVRGSWRWPPVPVADQQLLHPHRIPDRGVHDRRGGHEHPGRDDGAGEPRPRRAVCRRRVHECVAGHSPRGLVLGCRPSPQSW